MPWLIAAANAKQLVLVRPHGVGRLDKSVAVDDVATLEFVPPP